jgi:hypothetical protein
MKERPILFNGEMVRALLEGRKTQTRRVMKVQPHDDNCCISTLMCSTGDRSQIGKHRWLRKLNSGEIDQTDTNQNYFSCPYGQVGDRLWVRETWATVPATAYRASVGVPQTINPNAPSRAAVYRASFDRCYGGFVWKPSIHMPRWASRITLEVTGVRVERVQDITEEDAQAEGCSEWIPCGVYTGLKGVKIGGAHRKGTHREYFEWLWNSINEKRGYGWNANPYVWAVEFKRVET